MTLTRTLAPALLAALVLLTAPSAHAGLFGWTTLVKAQSGPTEFVRAITAPSHAACEFQRTTAINEFVALGYTILEAPSCSPVALRIPEYIPELQRKLPDFDCPWCPYLGDELIEVLFPEDLEQVRGLVEKYRIDSYRDELAELQRRYDLEGFEASIRAIEMEQQRDRQLDKVR